MTNDVLLDSLEYIDPAFIEEAEMADLSKRPFRFSLFPNLSPARRRIVVGLIALVLLGSIFLGGYELLMKPERLSEQEVASLRAKNPVIRYIYMNSPIASMTPPTVFEYISHAESFVYVSYVDTPDTCMKDGKVYFRYRVHVKKVAFGDKSLRGKSITIISDKRDAFAEISKKENRRYQIIAIDKKNADGEYTYYPESAYYVLDGYVLSVIDEIPGYEFSGLSVRAFFRELRSYRDRFIKERTPE